MVASTLIARRILLLSQSLDEKDAQLSSVKQASRAHCRTTIPGIAFLDAVTGMRIGRLGSSNQACSERRAHGRLESRICFS